MVITDNILIQQHKNKNSGGIGSSLGQRERLRTVAAVNSAGLAFFAEIRTKAKEAGQK